MNEKKLIIIANWKMKLKRNESIELAKDVSSKLKTDLEVVICPSFTNLPEVGLALKKSHIALGAQDCFWEANGAFTGEVSAEQLKDNGAEFVIIGHSERRKYLNETDEMVHKKVKMALDVGLTPIICVGETFEQRQEQATDYILIQQTTKALDGIALGRNQNVIIAYEPVWVIGTGQAISPSEADLSHQVIIQTLYDIFEKEAVENNFRVVYGGSVDENNVNSFTRLQSIEGVLVGGASLEKSNFLGIIDKV